MTSNFTTEVVLSPFLRMRTKSGQYGSEPGFDFSGVGVEDNPPTGDLKFLSGGAAPPPPPPVPIQQARPNVQ